MTAAKKLVRKSIRSVKFSRLELPFKPPAAGTVLTTSRSSLSLRRAVSVRCLISSKAFSNSILKAASSVRSQSHATRFGQRIRQTHLLAAEGNVGKLLQEFEKLPSRGRWST